MFGRKRGENDYMRKDYLRAHLKHRRAKIDLILASPNDYKVCCHCLSISFQCAGYCQLCRGYRWINSAEAVIAVATFMKTSPLPRTAGFAPRLPTEVQQQKQAGWSVKRKARHAVR